MLTGPDADCQYWADVLKTEGAEVLATYTKGDHAGQAAITSNTFGKGKAIYVGSRLEPPAIGRVLSILAAAAGIRPAVEAPVGVEVAMRHYGPTDTTFVLNHTSKPQTVTLEKSYKELVAGFRLSGAITVEPYGVRVLSSA